MRYVTINPGLLLLAACDNTTVIGCSGAKVWTPAQQDAFLAAIAPPFAYHPLFGFSCALALTGGAAFLF